MSDKPVTLGSILNGFTKRAPNLMEQVIQAVQDAGIPLDLGPMTPDVKAAFDKITAEARADLKKKFASSEEPR